MLMTTNVDNRPVYRFISWCTLFIFFVNILSYSVSLNSTLASQKSKSNYSIGEVINAFMGFFASDAEALEAEIALLDLVDIGTTDINNYAGSFSYSYPIKVLAGRAGLTPQLNLTYSSAEQNGWIGVGWDLTESWIERQTKFGKPSYTDSDIFIMKFMGSTMELVNESTGQYRAKNEKAFFRVVKSSSDYWVVTDKSGTKYYFGTTTILDGGSGSFRWYLDSIEDLNENEVTFSYYQDTTNNQVYLEQIDYEVGYHVVFVNDPSQRADSWSVWDNYFKQETVKRLKEIQVYHGDPEISPNLVRAYKLSYSYSAGTSRSVLTNVTEYGRGSTIGSNDLVTSGPSLPYTQFTINPANNSFAAPDPWQNAQYVKDDNYNYYVRAGDFNGDGKSDILYYSTSNYLMVMRSNGSDFITATPWYSSPVTISLSSWVDKFWVSDFNGDLKSDIMYCDGSDNYYVMLTNSSGTGFSSGPQMWHEAVSIYQNGNIAVGDINNDGMSDIVYHDDSTSYIKTSVMFSNGSNGFSGPYTWFNTGVPSTAESYPSIMGVVDFNDDGKLDLVLSEWYNNGATVIYYLYVMFNNGSAFSYLYELFWTTGYFTPRIGDFNGDGKKDLLIQNRLSHLDPEYENTCYVILGNGTTLLPDTWKEWYEDTDLMYSSLENDIWVLDLNGDSKSDVLYHSTDGNYKVMLSNGFDFIDPDPWQSYYTAYDSKIWVSDFSGNGQADLMYVNSSKQFMMMKNNAQYDLVNSIENTLGATTSMEYMPSSSWSQDYLPFKIQTVESITTSDNQGHSAIQTYEYAGGKYDIEEREYRGFEEVVVTDEETGFVTESHYHQDAVFKGRMFSSVTEDLAGKEVVGTDNYWEAFVLENDAITGGIFTPADTADIAAAADDRTFAHIAESIVTQYNSSGTPYSTITTNYEEYDSFGNFALEHMQTSPEGINRYTRTYYNNDTSYWILGKPTNIRIAESDPGPTGTPALRETKMEYETARPWLLHAKKLVNWGEGPPEEYITYYDYDTYGNLTKETDPRNPNWYTTIDYSESDWMFPNWTTNALGHTIHRTFEPDFGTILTETDPNGQITDYDYDAFGRVDYITYPDASYKDYSYNVQQNNHYVVIQASDQPTVTTYYDNFGRNKLEKTAATDGTIIYTETLYDNVGRITYESLPYYPNDTKYWTIYDYHQVRGYLEKQTNPDNNTFKTFTIDGLTETITDENNHTKTIIKDSLGRIKSVEEATGGTTEYDYDIFDNLTYVKDPMGNITNITYDDLGRKTSMDDPYMGHWEYDYDENGNLTWQKDANFDEITMTYDPLNRIYYKTYITNSREVDYVYDEARDDEWGYPYSNIGSLTTVASPEGTTTYNYDKMGRQVNEVRTIDSVDYVLEREYDLAGRLDYITYPTDGPEIDYSYHPIGFLSQVDKVESGSTMIAQYNMEDYNALGQVEYVSYGNGTGTQYDYYVGNFRLENMKTTLDTPGDIQDLSYIYDNVGNVTGITDNKNSVNHTFVYDEVNRLTTGTATGGSDPSRLYNQGYTYDLAGNMTSKTGIGGWEVLDHDSRHRPTAVAYDEEVAGVGERAIEYNQDNKPTNIEYNGQETYLYYDGEGDRIKKISNGETVIYVGGLYEIRGGQALSYIFANGQKIVTLTDDHEYYTHTDHLGSTTIVTNENGDAVEEIGYLPFGATLFRNVFNGSTWESAYKFTGQEFDPEYHLYNYNARLYDPIMGRFITPDTIVPEPYNPQSLNRYAYCLNNPLIYVDPTGHWWLDWLWNPVSDFFQQIFQSEAIAASSDIKSAGDDSDRAKMDEMKKNENKAKVDYGETSGLYPQLKDGGEYKVDDVYRSKNWDEKNAKKLKEAREAIADISTRNPVTWSDSPHDPNNSIEKQAWDLCVDAAKNSANSNLPKDVNYYFIRQEGVGKQQADWMAKEKMVPYESWGPFINVGGGSTPVGSKTYIDVYQAPCNYCNK